MKKLQRPTCNVNFQLYIHKGNNWQNLTPQDKDIIRNTLLAMTNNRCSYCEMEIITPKWHIEHLAPRSSNPDLTFVWENLFCSCNDNDTCGKYKDNIQQYSGNSNDLIKPDIDDPCDYLAVNIQDGSLYEKTPNPKASNTLRCFNLNSPKLNRFRLNFIDIAKNIIKQYQEFYSNPGDIDIADIHTMMIEEILENYQASNVDNLGFIQTYIQTL